MSLTVQAPAPRILECAGRSLCLDTPQVMGILNITPDSFSDGGKWFNGGKPELDRVLAEAHAMLDAGASLLDVGGESTRPGAREVSLGQELDRVIPVIETLVREFDAIVSVDTSKAAVMAEAAKAGAGMINDVRALSLPGALEAAAGTGLPVCVMHMQGQPDTMQVRPEYQDVLVEVLDFLKQRIEACTRAGIAPARVLIDPGFGFGKTPAHNLRLLKHLSVFSDLGCPILVGLSRKSLLGQITGRPVLQRTMASVSAALIAVQGGARILRVHDVAETVDALRVLAAVNAESIA